MDTLNSFGVAFGTAAVPGHGVGERVDVHRAAWHLGRVVHHRAVHADPLDQEALAHEILQVCVLKKENMAEGQKGS